MQYVIRKFVIMETLQQCYMKTIEIDWKPIVRKAFL